jgi:iron(III) transport system substrate-binding protein
MLVAACGSNSNPPANTGNPTTASAAADPTTDASTSGPVTGDALDELIAAAQAEGSLMFYHSPPDPGTLPFLDAFAKTYNLTVDHFHAQSTDLSVRFSQEADNDAVGGDIVYTTDQALFIQNPDWFATLSAADLPNLDRVPEQNLMANAVGLAIGSSVLMYNTNKLAAEDVPTTWEELGDPKWANETLIVDPQSSASFIKVFDALDVEYPGLLEKIAANNPRLMDAGASAAQALAAGTGTIAYTALASHALAVSEAGGPVGYVTMQGPEYTRPTWMGITADAPHPNAAKLFLNWWMSEEGVKAYCDANFGVGRHVLDDDGSRGCDPVVGVPEYLPEDNVPAERSAELMAKLGF